MRINIHVLIYIGLFLTSTLYCDACQEFNLNLDDVGQKLTGFVIQTREQISLANCARECWRLVSCLSFNHEKASGRCQLNSANRTTAGDGAFQQDPAFIYSDITRWPQQIVGHCSTKPCGPESTCIPNANSYICHALGPASDVIGPANCSMVKQCSPGSLDGEYWIYPALMNDTDKIKVHCHNMTTDAPKEYLTLRPNTNSAWHCGGDPVINGQKLINFEKVAVSLKTMSLIANDFTFSDDDGTANVIKFGVGAGCKNGLCTGSMDIDTTGTGLILDPTITWKKFGYNSFISQFSRSDDGTTINVRCGGFCGRCFPNGPLELQLNPNEGRSYPTDNVKYVRHSLLYWNI